MSLVVTPVHKILELDCPVEKAFATFTEGIAVWWPIETHSVYGEGGTVVFASDRIFEVGSDGEVAEWGRVSVWDPPRRVVTTWHPGTDPAAATELELRFEPLGDGRTRFELIHRGWETLDEGAEAMRDRYDVGWDAVLERYRT